MARPWCAPGKRFGPSAPVGKANREKDKEAFNGKKKRENATAALDKTHSSAAVPCRFGFRAQAQRTAPEGWRTPKTSPHRQVLECGCPLPLWISRASRTNSARGLAHSKSFAPPPGLGVRPS